MLLYKIFILQTVFIHMYMSSTPALFCVIPPIRPALKPPQKPFISGPGSASQN